MNPKNRLARYDHDRRQRAGGPWFVSTDPRPSNGRCVEVLNSNGRSA